MKRAIASAARDLTAYIAAQDENLLELPSGAGRAAAAKPAEIIVPAAEPAVSQAGASALDMESLSAAVSACRRCPLGYARIKPVFGVGNTRAKVVFVGEGPGFQEDHQGEPFVGRSGQLLDKILDTVLGLKRSEVYIANIVKCHPMKNPETPEAHGNDRPPTPEEISACRPYLEEQLRAIKPFCIVTLGSVPTKVLLATDKGISLVRGRVYDYPVELFGPGHPIKVIPTYHPAALLRNPNLKRDTWEDMKMLKSLLDAAGEHDR